MSTASTEKAWGPLSPKERRVLGVLIEKQKTTPEYYPMTIAALVTGSNQKSNRDPVTNYDADDIEEILQGLRRRGAVVVVEGSGRAVKWKHNLYEWFDLRNKPDEMAILAELLLRGPQTEGELRGRASRMNQIADLPTLQAMLEFLSQRGLVVYLTPPGQRRGVIVTHGLYPPAELERARQIAAAGLAEEAAGASPTPAATGPGSAGLRDEVEQLRGEVASLTATVRQLADELNALKASLGA